MKIDINYDLCVGTGYCEMKASKYFEIDDDGDTNILQETVDGADLEQVQAAVTACPTGALRLID